MKRRDFTITLGGIAAWPLAARAQQPIKRARIGFLHTGSPLNPDPYMEGFLARVRDLGHVEGKNIVIEVRYAKGNYERLTELAAELVRLDVDVLVTYAIPGVFAAKQATTTIPIVMAVSAEAVRWGFVASLSRPGGNITGMTYFNQELNVKRLEFVKEALPASRRIGAFFNPDNQKTVRRFSKPWNLPLNR
jgi:putative ABC transport system substrate-binding protein